jgi:hypothetical protein
MPRKSTSRVRRATSQAAAQAHKDSSLRPAVTQGSIGTAALSIMTMTTIITSQIARLDTSFRLPKISMTTRCFERYIAIYQEHGTDTINCSPNLAGGWISTLPRAIGKDF